MIRSAEDMTRRDEGREYKAYPDPLSPYAIAARKGLPTAGLNGAPWTIGEGHTGPEVHEGLVWDDFQIDAAKELDLAKAWTECMNHFSPWFSQLCAPRQAVLQMMAFQLGIGVPGESGLLEFVHTLAAVRDQHFDLAADGMRSSLWGKQTPERVGRMACQMATGNWN